MMDRRPYSVEKVLHKDTEPSEIFKETRKTEPSPRPTGEKSKA